ncbi:MAG: SDR family oxidoreductase [Geminicoccaceae bacterium]|nr:MAG: SDR family oxidoreductase [Geminicoccaceae bacterium]
MVASGLAGRVALVTGGANGLGRATSAALAEKGCAVAVLDWNGEAAVEAARALAAAGAKSHAVVADVADGAAAEAAFREVEARLGPVDVLVNNAGIMPQERVPHHAQPFANFEAMLRIHVDGTARFCHLAVPSMRERGFGRIVNLASALSVQGAPYRLGYVTAKTALVGLTRGLAIENARFGITVNAIAPGYVLTDVHRRAIAIGKLDHDLYAERTPLGRWGRPEEIARVIAFLAEPASEFVTGALWPVDGGYTARGDAGEEIGPRPEEVR